MGDYARAAYDRTAPGYVADYVPPPCNPAIPVETMSATERLLGAGAIVYGALYLGLVVWVGVYANAPWAVIWALVGLAASNIGFTVQIVRAPRALAIIGSLASFAAGLLAGLSLLPALNLWR